MEHKLKQVLNQSRVKTAISKMFAAIYAIKEPLAIIAILKGGTYVAYELLKYMNDIYATSNWPDIVIGHIGLESYGDEMKSQGEMKLMTPLDLSRKDIYGRNVIIVDDCVETGNTLEEAKKIISGYDPNLLYTAVLVDKVTLRADAQAAKPDIIGWSYTGTGFLVGCGMGDGEKYRGLPEICEVVEENNDV